MSRFWKIALIVIAVLVVLALGARLLHRPGAKPGAGTAQEGAGADATPVPVTVEPVQRQDVPIYLTALGTVQALNTVSVTPQVSGQLLKLFFVEGQEVKAGELIAQIDPRTFQAAYDQAVANKARDEAQLATARGNYARSRNLAPQGYISKQDLDNLRNTVSQLEGTVAADAAAIRDAQVQLGYTRVLSPIDGVAGILNVDPGNLVNTSTTLVTLTQLRPINVIFKLPEQNLAVVRDAFRGGTPLEVQAVDRTDAHVIAGGGVLKVIDNQIDSSTGTFKLKSEFPNADNALWPGQFVNVRLKVRTVKGGLVIPAQAVQRGPDGDYVYQVQADSTVKTQPVTVAAEVDESHVMVSTGLAAGDRVVTEGQFRLKPGSKVKALKPGEVPQAPVDAAKDKGQGRRGARGRG